MSQPNPNSPIVEESGSGFARQEADVADAPPPEPLKLSQAASLADLHADWRFFTHAILFRYGQFPHDPVQEWVNATQGKSNVTIFQFPEFIFSGLGKMNHTLFACRKEKWKDLRKFLSSVAGVNRDTKRFCRVFYHRIRLKDTMALRRVTMLPDPIPTVPLTVFGCAYMDKVFYLKQPDDGISTPQVETAIATAEDKAMGFSVLGDCPTQTLAAKPVRLVWNAQRNFFEPEIVLDPDDE